MAKRPKRSMIKAKESQTKTEATSSTKFTDTAFLANQEKKKEKSTSGRISPQISCTIGKEDKEMLNELTLYATNKRKEIVNVSTVLRTLIRFGFNRKDELNFNE